MPESVPRATLPPAPAPSGVQLGAAILPLMVDPSFNCVYALLGREAHGGGWGPFGGRARHDHEGAAAAAAREFVEETCGSVRFAERDALPRRRWDDIGAKLQRGEFLMKLDTQWSAGRFSTFVCQVPWQPEAVETFRRTRASLDALRQHCNGGEPDVVTWAAMHPADDSARAAAVADVLRHPAVASRQVRDVPLWAALAAEPDSNRRVLPRTAAQPPEDCADAASRRVTLTVVDSVAPEWLEKDALHLFSVPDLAHAVHSGGTLPTRLLARDASAVYSRSCRPSALPAIAAMLRELSHVSFVHTP